MYGKFRVSFISAHETSDQHLTCYVYIFVQDRCADSSDNARVVSVLFGVRPVQCLSVPMVMSYIESFCWF